MKITRVARSMFGVKFSTKTIIELNQRELATIRRAGQIAEEARGRLRAVIPDAEMLDLDTDLANIEHTAADFVAAAGRLIVAEDFYT